MARNLLLLIALGHAHENLSGLDSLRHGIGDAYSGIPATGGNCAKAAATAAIARIRARA